MLQAHGRLANVIAGAGNGQRAVALDDLAQVHAVLDVLHHQQVVAVDLGGVEGADDVWMIELGGGTDLPLKSLYRLEIDDAVLADNLESDDASQTALPGLVHRAHAAFAQALKQ